MPHQQKSITDQPCKDFNQDDLDRAWDKFTTSISKEMPRLHQVLKNNKPVIGDHYTIYATVNSELQKKDIEDRLYNKITGWLKKELNNYSLRMEFSVVESEDAQQLIYTSTDKFNYLSEKNKNLLKLKQNFDLDFD